MRGDIAMLESATLAATRILIAEDDEITRVGLKLTLEEDPLMKVIGVVADGHAAITKVGELLPKVVLMDIALPGITGIAATQKIKAMFPQVRVIIITAHSNDKDIFAALAAGADGYCLKEISKQQLVLAIKTVSDGAAWFGPGVASRVLRSVCDERVKGQSLPASPLLSPSPLSQRAADVLRCVIDGLRKIEMAERLFVSVETVKTHMRHIMDKLKVDDRTQAAVKAMREGLV